MKSALIISITALSILLIPTLVHSEAFSTTKIFKLQIIIPEAVGINSSENNNQNLIEANLNDKISALTI